MSLWDEALEKCTMIDRRTESDGYGGYRIIWTDGAEFDAAIAFNSSMEARAAQAAGATEMYTVTTRKNINLNYHDVFRRESDGKVFRVKSDGDDNKTPASAALNMRAVEAEEWVIPNE